MRRLPLYLVNLRPLRNLEVDTLGSTIHYRDDALSIMVTLQEQLERLVFRVDNWFHALPFTHALNDSFLPQASKITDASQPFQRLQYLELPTHYTSLLDNSTEFVFPPNLTEMTTCALKVDQMSELERILPPKLTRWNAGNMTDQDTVNALLNHLPPRITELRCIIVDSNKHRRSWHISYLDPALKSLGQGTQAPNLKKFEKWLVDGKSFKTLPFHICTNPRRVWLDKPCIEEILERPALAELITSLQFDQPIRSRPWERLDPLLALKIPSLLPLKSLTHIRGCIDLNAGPSIADWPKTITSLHLELLNNYIAPPSEFPPSITRLAITSSTKFPLPFSIFNRLPRMLKYFKANVIALSSEEVSFPPFLTTLKLTDTFTSEAAPEAGVPEEKSPLEEEDCFLFDISNNDTFFTPKVLRVFKCFPFEKLPATLRHLRLAKGLIPFSRLCHLPPCLQSLQAAFFKDADYDDQDPIWTERIRYLHQKALQDGVPDSIQNSRLAALSSASSGTSPSIRVLDLLPRTLTSFRMESSHDIDGWDGLPFLRRLHIQSYEMLDSDIVFRLPMSLLTDLHIETLQSMKDEHVKALGRSIRNLTLEVFSWDTSEDVWKFWPLEDASSRNAPSDMHDRLVKWRHQAINALRYPTESLFNRAMDALKVAPFTENSESAPEAI